MRVCVSQSFVLIVFISKSYRVIQRVFLRDFIQERQAKVTLTREVERRRTKTRRADQNHLKDFICLFFWATAVGRTTATGGKSDTRPLGV